MLQRIDIFTVEASPRFNSFPESARGCHTICFRISDATQSFGAKHDRRRLATLLRLLQEAPAEALAGSAREDGLRLLQPVALRPAVLLPDLEVHGDVVALRGDALQDVDGVIQGALVVRLLLLLLLGVVRP